ncbi:MAG: FUN14 domain-containing protein [Candidatus Babeliales bacterium]
METDVKQSWFEVLQEKAQKFADHFEISWSKSSEYGIACGGGFLVGFLVKRYARPVILTALVVSALLLGLNYFEIITINWVAVKEFIGMTPSANFEGFFQEYWEWASTHAVTVIFGILGFVVGYKIG